MLVTLLIIEFVTTSAPEPSDLPRMKAKSRFPMPEQYGMKRVPRTVPSTPLLVMASSRQINQNDETRKRRTNSTGPNGPNPSMNVASAFNARS